MICECVGGGVGLISVCVGGGGGGKGVKILRTCKAYLVRYSLSGIWLRQETATVVQ